MAAIYQGHDHFSDLPAEVAIEIIARVSSKQFLTISHVSVSFRALIQDHGQAIANTAILARYPNHARFLKCKLVDGWLTATLPKILELEHDIETITIRHIKRSEERNKSREMHGQLKSLRKLDFTLSTPGPQLLYMLDEEVVLDETQVDEFMAAPIPDKPTSSFDIIRVREYLDERNKQLGRLFLARLSVQARLARTRAINGIHVVGTTKPVWDADQLYIHQTIPRGAFGISALALGNCLQDLNELKLVSASGPIDWFENCLDGAIKELRPKPLLWYFGVPTWFVSKPSDPVWDLWAPMRVALTPVVVKDYKSIVRFYDSGPDRQDEHRDKVLSLQKYYSWFPSTEH